MFILASTFINNLVNHMIRDLSTATRIVIATLFAILALISFYCMVKKIKKDNPKLKIGWLILTLISIALSVCYIVL
ncbi:MAG: hypothetical protein ACI4T1_00540 [Christensenellales bacterium]